MINWEIFASNLFFHELLHFLAAILISLYVVKKYHSFKLVIGVFLISFLIDADHLTEWFWVYKTDLVYIFSHFNGGYFREAGKITIFFHSWELLPLVWFLGKIWEKERLAKAIILAVAGHYLVDQLVYTSLFAMPLWQYSLIYRAINQFSFWKLCGGC
jgi:hypothetical protein